MDKCPFSHSDDTRPAPAQDRISRRGFLQRGLVGMAAAFALTALPLGQVAAQAAGGGPWVAHPFAGDQWEQCHDLRDGKAFPRGGPVEEVDVVVIGGGISGLIAAHQLAPRHHVVILEKEPIAGGNSRFGTWDDTRYPFGALYFAKPSKEIDRFLRDVGLPAVPIPGSVDTLYTQGHFVDHIFGDGVMHAPWPIDERRAFQRAWQHFAAYNEGDDYPDVPIQGNSRKALALDTLTFLQYCKNHRLHPHVIKFLDQYVRSCWGVGSEKVSAFAAINFLGSEFEPLYAYPGGNGAMSHHLARLVQRHLRTRCFVDRVTQDKKGVHVDYVFDGRPARIRARTAIMATPKHITLKMMPGLPEALSTPMRKARFGSYLVGEIGLREPLADRAFDLWVENRWYSDLCLADWVASGGKPAAKRKTVMAASIPMGEMEGRAALLTTPHEEFYQRLLSELEKDFPGCTARIEGIQFARYGHPMIIPYPGFVTKIAPVFYKPWGRIWWANCDSQGMACFESAFSAAMMAVEGVADALERRTAAL